MKQFLLPEHRPILEPGVFIAPGAVVIGAVTLGAYASVWYQCVLRGDINRIQVGARSNIQDGTVIHVADNFAAIVGERVTVGHRAIIHACTIGDETLVGMNAVVLDGAQIGPRCIIGASALVPKNFVAPEGSLILGAPAKIIRPLRTEEIEQNVALAEKYVEVSRRFLELPASQK